MMPPYMVVITAPPRATRVQPYSLGSCMLAICAARGVTRVSE